MPELGTRLHLNLLADSYKNRSQHVLDLVKTILAEDVYGIEWGHPDLVPPLGYIRDKFVLPYVDSDQTAVEIGVGGGRWTRYLTPFAKLYLVDYHQELLDEVRKSFDGSNLHFIRNNGSDFPGIEDQSVDFVFSFGSFVYFDLDLIESYFDNIRRIVKPGGNIVIHYSDKNKVLARRNPDFSDNTPDIMNKIVTNRDYRILEEDTTSLWHSSILRCTI